MIVIYKNPNVFSVGSFDFKPGTNEVPADVWAQVLKNPMGKARFEEGKLEVAGGAGVKGEKVEMAELKDVTKLSPAAAAKVVEHAHNPDHLAEIKGADRRPEVQTAAKKQEEKIEAANKPKAKG